MSKYHINSKGEPAICKATKGNCPFGGSDSHYSTLKEAQIEADKRNENEYSLLPDTKETEDSKKYFRKATKQDKGYIRKRKAFLYNETPAPTYIKKCKSCFRLKNSKFYEKNRNQETYHFDKERKGRADRLEDIYGDGETVGFYEVNHKLKGKDYTKQIIEVRSTGQLIVYDKHKGHKVTTFMGHRARIETMMILAGEIPDQDLMNTITNNHTNDLKRQNIDRQHGLA